MKQNLSQSFSLDSIEKVLESLDFSKIRRYPTEYRTSCPFCQNEETQNPAFKIGLDGNYFCFACNEKGKIQDLPEKLGKSVSIESIETIAIEKISENEKIAQAEKIYYSAMAISQEKMILWLLKRGFNKTQTFEVMKKIDFQSIRYREYKGEKEIIIPICSPIQGVGFRGIERINFESDKTKPEIQTWGKKSLGKKDGFFYLSCKDSKKTIITESMANAFVNALFGYNSIVTFGINNIKHLPLTVSLLQKQGHTVYYFPDALGIEKDSESSKEAKKFFSILKEIPDLFGVLWPSDVKKNYDVNDMLIDVFQEEIEYREKENKFQVCFEELILNSFTYQNYVNEQKRLKKIEEIEKTTKEIISNTKLSEALKDEATRILISASTGLGKTKTACIRIVELFKQGEKITYFVSTLKDVLDSKDGIISILKGLLPEDQHNQIDIVISDSMEIEESQEQKSKKQKRELGKICITTYAYLDLKGETDKAYSIAKKLIENRVVICDEIQELWHKSQVLYPIASNYLKINDGETITYKQFTKCPKTARKGNCQNCKVIFQREAANGNPKKREFPKSINEKGFDNLENIPVIEIFKDCLNTDSYIHIMANLFYKPLNTPIKAIKELYAEMENLYTKDDSCNYKAWIETRIKFLYNPHLRIEFPTMKTSEGIKPIDRKNLSIIEEMTGIKFTIQSCSIPLLAGRSLLPFLQLMKAKKLIMMSATIPDGLLSFLDEISKELSQEKFKKFVIDEIPFKFNITCLKTNKRLSLDRQAKIIRKIENEKVFLCTARQYETDAIYEDLRLLKGVALYYRKDWIQNGEDAKEISKNEPIKIIITYARSAITKGSNFPEICIAIIDCNQFIPYCAINKINPLLTQEEIKNLITQEIKENLAQIAGRFLRSTLQRESGKTLIDNRNIVLLLHGLPDSVQDFSIDERLLNSYREYNNEQFLSSLPRYEIESCIDALTMARQGLDIPNRKQKDHDNILQKAIEKGLDSIHSDDRFLLSQEDMAKINHARQETKEKEKSKESIDSRLKELKSQGKTWNQAYDKLHLERVSKIEKSRLKSLWKNI